MINSKKRVLSAGAKSLRTQNLRENGVWVIILDDRIPNTIILNVKTSKDQNPKNTIIEKKTSCFSSAAVCVCSIVYVYGMFVWVCAQMRAGVWGPEADSWNLPQLLAILFFEHGLSLSPEFSNSARLVAQTAGICLFPILSQPWRCRRRPLHPAFHVASRGSKFRSSSLHHEHHRDQAFSPAPLMFMFIFEIS